MGRSRGVGKGEGGAVKGKQADTVSQTRPQRMAIGEMRGKRKC